MSKDEVLEGLNACLDLDWRRIEQVWGVQYGEYGHPSIYEDKQLLEPPSLEPQGHAQGMIEPKGKLPGMYSSPPLSFHDFLFIHLIHLFMFLP